MQTTNLDPLNASIQRLESGISALSTALTTVAPKLSVESIVDLGGKEITDRFKSSLDKYINKKLDSVLTFDTWFENLDNKATKNFTSIFKHHNARVRIFNSEVEKLGKGFGNLFNTVKNFAKVNPFAFAGIAIAVVAVIALIIYHWDYLCELFQKTKHILIPLLSLIGIFVLFVKGAAIWNAFLITMSGGAALVI